MPQERMLDTLPEDSALDLLRRALNVGAPDGLVRHLVLCRLAVLYRHKSDDELRNALAHAWAVLRRGS